MEEDVGCAAVELDCGLLAEDVGRRRWKRTLAVHGEVDVFDTAVFAKDFAEMAFIDVFSEFFDYDLGFLSVQVGEVGMGSYFGAFWCCALASTMCIASISVFSVSTRAFASRPTGTSTVFVSAETIASYVSV